MEGYTIYREAYEFLVEKSNGEIGWSKYKIDATFYDTEEEAEAVRLKLGLVFCGVGWHSNKGVPERIRNSPYLPPPEERIVPGQVGHPTGGKVKCWLDVLYEIAKNHQAYGAEEKKLKTA